MKNKKLMVFNIIIVFMLFGVIYVGYNTWGTEHEVKESAEAAEANIERERELKTKQRSTVEIKESPQLIHTPFKKKHETDFDLFNRNELEIVEMEDELEAEEEMMEDDVMEEPEWEEPSENIDYSSEHSNAETSTKNEADSQKITNESTTNEIDQSDEGGTDSNHTGNDGESGEEEEEEEEEKEEKEEEKEDKEKEEAGTEPADEDD